MESLVVLLSFGRRRFMTVHRKQAMHRAIHRFDLLFANHMPAITTLYPALP